MLARGTLWDTTVQCSRRARESGALRPIDTRQRWAEDGGVRFCIRYVSSLARKPAPQNAMSKSRQDNPFLPYPPDMFVAELSETHLALLNKFPVFDNHLLLVTRVYEDQETLLTPADFEAVAIGMAEFEALAFFNAGTRAGASQPHKHLQLVPLPLADIGPAIPVEPLLNESCAAGTIYSIPAFRFDHCCACIDPSLFVWPSSGAQRLRSLYLDMLALLGLEGEARDGAGSQRAPYNLLVSREWMLLVPRMQERFAGISINALAFAGSIFVPWPDAVDQIVAAGPMRALRAVARPRPP